MVCRLSVDWQYFNMEPVSDDSAAQDDENHYDAGFNMQFMANIQPVTLKTDKFRPLLAKTCEINDLQVCPPGCKGCENCARLTQLIEIANG